jgi:hypothetical protein
VRLRTCALGNREPLDHEVEIKFEPEKARWAPIKQGDLPWVAIAAQKDQENTFTECFTGLKACKIYTRKCLTWLCLRVIINEILRPVCRFMLVGTELIRRISRNPYLFIRRPQFLAEERQSTGHRPRIPGRHSPS